VSQDFKCSENPTGNLKLPTPVIDLTPSFDTSNSVPNPTLTCSLTLTVPLNANAFQFVYLHLRFKFSFTVTDEPKVGVEFLISS